MEKHLCCVPRKPALFEGSLGGRRVVHAVSALHRLTRALASELHAAEAVSVPVPLRRECFSRSTEAPGEGSREPGSGPARPDSPERPSPRAPLTGHLAETAPVPSVTNTSPVAHAFLHARQESMDSGGARGPRSLTRSDLRRAPVLCMF